MLLWSDRVSVKIASPSLSFRQPDDDRPRKRHVWGTKANQSGMVTRLPQGVLDRLFDASLVTIMGMPPKDPHDDDDENEDDEEDDEEEDEEPAVIREPDEC